MAAVPNPAEIIMAQDSNTVTLSSWVRPYREPAYNRYRLWQNAVWNLHFDGSNLLYVDGHVKWQKFNSICGYDYGLSSFSDDAGGKFCGKTATGYGRPRF